MKNLCSQYSGKDSLRRRTASSVTVVGYIGVGWGVGEVTKYTEGLD